MDMAVHRLDFLALDARKHHQLEMDRQEIFANDVHVGERQQIVNIGDATSQRVLDGDHGEIGSAGFNRVEGILKSRARQRLHIGKHIAARRIGICARFTLKGNPVGFHRTMPS